MPSDPSPVLSGRYRIDRLVGRGGMASVYLAHDLKHDRRVAVKVLEADLARSVSGERFLREIRIAANLSHPNILPLHDSGQDGDRLFYVMPYVAGETLRAKLDREGQLPAEESLRIACEVAGALDHAHRNHVLHRDIKPENILLADGHAVVADFGIARALDTSVNERVTVTGMAMGTPVYMSPEQAAGDGRLDARSDVYALSCVLYEMLAGEPPFTGPTALAILGKRLGCPPPRIRTVRPSVPVRLEEALLRGLAPVPADRFGTASEFAATLAVCAQGHPRSRAVRPLRAGLVATAGMLGLLTAGWLFHAQAGAPGAGTVLAVLPLTYQQGDAAYDFLAEGLTHALIGELADAHGVRVISRMSAMRYAAMGGSAKASAGAAEDAPQGRMAGGMGFMEIGPANPSESAAPMLMGGLPPLSRIGRDLNADVLLRGAVVHEGDSVRVEVALIRSASLEQLWTGSFRHHVRDLFALQRDLSRAVVAAVTDRVPVLSADPGKAYHPVAHEAFLKGSYFQAHWRLAQAVDAFERAVQLDPSHAPAQAGLARAYYFRAFFGDLPPGIALGRMRRAAHAALEQDSLMAEAHAQLALVKMLQEWDWQGAERHFRRALELSPRNAQIRHDYAHFLLGQGRQRESAEETRQAVALDPVNPMLISCLGWHSLFDAQYEEAHRFAVEANEMMPDHWAYIVLGWSLLGQGNRDPALAAFREARRLNEGAFTLAALGHALAVTGHEDEARSTLVELLDRVEHEYVSPYDIATVHAGLGDADEAFKWLRRAAEERSTFIVHVGWDSRFDRIRSDARFAALMKDELRLPMPRFAAVTAAERRSM